MVQLHAAYAGLALTRPTRDVDMILHIETGATTFGGVRDALERLGYTLHDPVGDGPVHRFVRGPDGTETVDAMVADHLPPKCHQKALRRNVFAVPGGTSALRKAVNFEVDTGEAAAAHQPPISPVVSPRLLSAANASEESLAVLDHYTSIASNAWLHPCSSDSSPRWR